MRKTLASRIIGLTAIYCIVFCSVVILQFSSKGNFSLNKGSINIKGRYLEANNRNNDIIPIEGGVKLFYGGLEFNLREERGKGLTLTGTNDDSLSVNPEFMMFAQTEFADSVSVRFVLPGGTSITFSSFDSERGHEMQINTEFADNVSKIIIPIKPRRSSLVRDHEQVGIMFSGNRYFFNNPNLEIEEGKIVLSKEVSFISYRARSKQTAFDPSNFILAQSQDYETVVRNWQNASFTFWNQNTANITENDIIAYLSESLGRGNFTAMLNTLPPAFINSQRHSFRSAVFTGGMRNAYLSFNTFENERISLITGLIREGSLSFLKEENVIDYLFSRSYTALANEAIQLITSAEPSMLNIAYCAGLLEVYSDIRKWSAAGNSDPNYPIGHLADKIISLISENLIHDKNEDNVHITAAEDINKEYNVRLGKALNYWVQNSGLPAQWSSVGKSLVLSAIADNNSGSLYNILNLGNYYPRAALLLQETGHWAWTISPAVRATYIDGNLNLAFNFPISASHYAIIRGVRPFIKIQIYDMDWRTDSNFEQYDSSGWVYYPQDQTLVLKVRHRALVENVRIFYRVEEPPPPPPPPVITEPPETEGEVFE
ncbi:MAG: hypothetical protein FWB86_04800 [Treponema sp.]|nr:hypothetical protein [Treponema sp.]MCL2250716.1 hypothetical protein [Treponema sp.]